MTRHFEDESVTFHERREILKIMLNYFEMKRKTKLGERYLKEFYPHGDSIRQLERDLSLFNSMVSIPGEFVPLEYETNCKLMASFIKLMNVNCSMITLNDNDNLYESILTKTKISIEKKRHSL